MTERVHPRPGALILRVDDAPNIVELARLYFERQGFHTVRVTQASADPL